MKQGRRKDALRWSKALRVDVFCIKLKTKNENTHGKMRESISLSSQREANEAVADLMRNY